MNRTDQFSDEEILQGIGNFRVVRDLCKVIGDSLTVTDPMKVHFREVVKFCNSQIVASTKLLDRRIDVVKE